MSKPLALKLSSPLSENVQIGPKVSIFCVATIIFQHCLNPLEHGVYWSFTGCHWSPLALLHDDITELVDVGDIALLHLPFVIMPHRSPLPSASLARQWSLSCWITALRPSLRREGILLCFSMSQYMLAFMVPSMNISSAVPAALMQPQTMTLSPSCLTVGNTHLSLYSSPGCHHTHLTPSEHISVSWSPQTTGHGSSNPCP